LFGPLLAPSVQALFAALVAFGACNGAMDVAMNAQAAAVERRSGRPIMSSFHGLWSIGGLVGAATAAGALHAGWSPLAHVWLASLTALGAFSIVVRPLLPPACDAALQGPRFARPSGLILMLGLMAALALLAEGAMGDWSAVYLRHSLGTTAALA